jgi:hypothetical protein
MSSDLLLQLKTFYEKNHAGITPFLTQIRHDLHNIIKSRIRSICTPPEMKFAPPLKLYQSRRRLQNRLFFFGKTGDFCCNINGLLVLEKTGKMCLTPIRPQLDPNDDDFNEINVFIDKALVGCCQALNVFLHSV